MLTVSTKDYATRSYIVGDFPFLKVLYKGYLAAAPANVRQVFAVRTQLEIANLVISTEQEAIEPGG